jgi:hypothetical protein
VGASERREGNNRNCSNDLRFFDVLFFIELNATSRATASSRERRGGRQEARERQRGDEEAVQRNREKEERERKRRERRVCTRRGERDREQQREKERERNGPHTTESSFP